MVEGGDHEQPLTILSDSHGSDGVNGGGVASVQQFDAMDDGFGCVWRVWFSQEKHLDQHQQQAALEELAASDAAMALNPHKSSVELKKSTFHMVCAALLSPLFYTFPCVCFLVFSVLVAIKVDFPFVLYLNWSIVFIPIYLAIFYSAVVGAIDFYMMFCVEEIHDFLEREFLYFSDKFWKKALNLIGFMLGSIFCIMFPGFLDQDAAERGDFKSLNVLMYSFLIVYSVRASHDLCVLAFPSCSGRSQSEESLVRRGYNRPSTTLYRILKVTAQICVASGLFLLWQHFEMRQEVKVNLKYMFEVIFPGLMFLCLFLAQPALFAVRKISIASRTQHIDRLFIIDFLQVVTEIGIFTLVTLVVFGTLLCLKMFKNANINFTSICMLPWIYGFSMIIFGTIGSFGHFKQAVSHFGGQPNLPWFNDNDLKVLMEMS
jgi:hypothetical protein